MPWREELRHRLSKKIQCGMSNLSDEEASAVTEIRVRAGNDLRFVLADGEQIDCELLSQQDVDDLVNALCGYSRYAFEAQMAQGYIALPGGHRAGVCGRVVYEEGGIVRMSAVRSVCIRVAREIKGASRGIRDFLFCNGRCANLLLLGPPGSGKTTILRDAALYLACVHGMHVAAADEREELFFGKAGVPVDVLSGAKKAQALCMLTRTMAPQTIVTDEIGGMEDAHALLEAVSCGVSILASAHGSGMEDVLRRPSLRLLYENGAFDRYAFLAGRGAGVRVWAQNGKQNSEEIDGES